jgi:hypothetical protein
VGILRANSGLNPIMVLRAGSYTQQGNQGYAIRYKSPAMDKWHSWREELSPGDSNENCAEIIIRNLEALEPETCF